MRVVVDSSILFSAFITPSGKTANILLNPSLVFEKYCCHFLIVELFKHQPKIIQCSRLDEEEVLEVLYTILKKIDFINDTQIPIEIWEEANELTIDVDKADKAHVALTLHIEDSYLWTGDKPLIKELKIKGFERVLTTDELLRKLIENSN